MQEVVTMSQKIGYKKVKTLILDPKKLFLKWASVELKSSLHLTPCPISVLELLQGARSKEEEARSKDDLPNPGLQGSPSNLKMGKEYNRNRLCHCC